MTDLRSACIEALARSLQEANLEGGFTWQEYLPDARAGLDALLGVLEEHADEWIAGEAVLATTPGPRRERFWFRMGRGQVTRLLAVLREDKMSDIPDFQMATLAATANVLTSECGVEWDEAVRVSILIDTAIKEALVEFGPELTLTAAEVLWHGGSDA